MMSGSVELTKSELARALRNVEYALPRKSAGASPMSGKIRVSSSAAGLQFRSSDSDSYITHVSDGVSVDGIDLVLPLSPLKKTLGAFEEESFEIAHGDGEELLISQIEGTRKLTLRGEAPPGVAPEWPEISAAKSAGVIRDARALASAIDRALLFVADHSERPTLSSVLFDLSSDSLVSTDSYRIMKTSLPEISGRRSKRPRGSSLISARSAQALARILRREPGELRLSHADDLGLIFRIGGVELVPNPPQGSFPDVEELLSAVKVSAKLRVSRDSFQSSLRAIAALNEGGRRSSPAVLDLSESSSTLSFSSSEGSSLSERINSSYEGTPLQICFNQKYLSDALTAVTGDELVIGLSSASAPALISDDQTVCLLMPVRKKTLS